MERTEWLTRLCADNDAARVPTTPFSVNLGGDYYTLATDRFALVVVLPDPTSIFLLNTNACEKKVIRLAQTMQKNSTEVGMLDALLLKELVGEPQWGPEHMKTLLAPKCSIRIRETHYAIPVLARLLAGWDDPLARVYQAPIIAKDNAPALLLTTQGMVLICAPVRLRNGGHIAETELPAGTLMEK